MYYLVSADGDQLESKISKRFGHSRCHLLVKPDTMEIQSVSGDVHDEPRHGTLRFKEEDISCVITGNVGPHAFEDIKARGWDLFIIRSVTVEQAVNIVKEGAIKPVDEPTMKRSIHDGQGRCCESEGRHQHQRQTVHPGNGCCGSENRNRGRHGKRCCED